MDKSYNRGRYLSNPFIRLQYKSSRKKGKVFLFPILISLINGDDYFELILVNIFSFFGMFSVLFIVRMSFGYIDPLIYLSNEV